MLGGVLLTKRAFFSWKLDSHKINMYIELTYDVYIYILPVLVKKTKKTMMITTVTRLMILVFPFPLHFPSFF